MLFSVLRGEGNSPAVRQMQLVRTRRRRHNVDLVVPRTKIISVAGKEHCEFQHIWF
ncbi:hypothetical protein Mapa_000587 [Marchantia paleacea]|nr:hypothetical protein Mapa_000587 [Marchantia paleacea]